jgi:hypothetical protein
VGWSARLASRALQSLPESKKAEELPPLSETIVAPGATDPASTILKLDQLCSLVLKKTNQAWIWIGLCRKTLTFSKSLLMHEACPNLFLYRFNHERASILM